jgi:hypothetical protein
MFEALVVTVIDTEPDGETSCEGDGEPEGECDKMGDFVYEGDGDSDPEVLGDRLPDTEPVSDFEGEDESQADTEGLGEPSTDTEGIWDRVAQEVTEKVSLRERVAVLVPVTVAVARAEPDRCGLEMEGELDPRALPLGRSNVEDIEGVDVSLFDAVVVDVVVVDAEIVFDADVEPVLEGDAPTDAETTNGDALLDAEPPNHLLPCSRPLHSLAECVGDSVSVPVERGDGVFFASSTVLVGTEVLDRDGEARAEALSAAEKLPLPLGLSVPECDGEREPPPKCAAWSVGKGARE